MSTVKTFCKQQARGANTLRSNSMRLTKFLIVPFCFLIAAVSGLAQTSTQKEQVPSGSNQRQLPVPLVPRILQQDDKSTAAEKSDSPWFKGKAHFNTLRRDLVSNIKGSSKNGPVVKSSAGQRGLQGGHKQMPFWQGSFNFMGANFPFRMIGTDPATGSATTSVRVMIIPLDLTFGDGTELSASQTACGDTQSSVSRILKSPLFQSFPFTVGGTFLGNTQYEDGFQRANFWSNVSTTSPNYHVLLVGTAGSTQSFALPPLPAQGFPTDLTVAGPCARIGFEDQGDLDARVQNVIKTLDMPGDVLPVFVMYNTFATSGGSCCILGYHTTTFDTHRHPYIVTSYSDPGLFFQTIQDIHALSHELGEWMDDPFVRSFVPLWGNVGQVSGCVVDLETGDAVTGIATALTMNGFTYHPEDLVFLSWFARQTPSTAVNGQYTLLNSFSAPQGICGQ
jgi:hypothetical protein